MPFLLCLLLTVLSGGVSACVIFDDEGVGTPATRPLYEEVREAARAAEIVAIVHVDRVAWRTPEEEAEFHRLEQNPPLNTPFSYTPQTARFIVRRVLKGEIPPGSGLPSGVTSCESGFSEGTDYVLLAMLPAEPGGWLLPLSAFAMDGAEAALAALAELDSIFTSSH